MEHTNKVTFTPKLPARLELLIKNDNEEEIFGTQLRRLQRMMDEARKKKEKTAETGNRKLLWPGMMR